MPDHRGKYTLDELFRAKREEKPDDAFWSDFDRSLKNKQRRLLQRQVVADEGRRSPFAPRFFRLAAFGSAAGFAAIALYVTVGTQQESGSSTRPAPIAATPATEPSFAVAEPTPVAPAKAAEALQEFATIVPAPRPRIVIERVNPSPSRTAAAQTATVAMTERRPPVSTARAADLHGLDLEFLNAKGLFDAPVSVAEGDTTDLEGLPSFERAYALGKYADPLADILPGSRASAKPLQRALSAQPISLSDIDEALSSHGERGSRTLDSVTLRF